MYKRQDVHSENKIFYIDFEYNGKNISIKTYNLDYTFRYLEILFDKIVKKQENSDIQLAS